MSKYSKSEFKCEKCGHKKGTRQERHIKIASYLILLGVLASILSMLAVSVAPEDFAKLIELSNASFYVMAGFGFFILIADMAFNKNRHYKCKSCGHHQHLGTY